MHRLQSAPPPKTFEEFKAMLTNFMQYCVDNHAQRHLIEGVGEVSFSSLDTYFRSVQARHLKCLLDFVEKNFEGNGVSMGAQFTQTRENRHPIFTPFPSNHGKVTNFELLNLPRWGSLGGKSLDIGKSVDDIASFTFFPGTIINTPGGRQKVSSGEKCEDCDVRHPRFPNASFFDEMTFDGESGARQNTMFVTQHIPTDTIERRTTNVLLTTLRLNHTNKTLTEPNIVQ